MERTESRSTNVLRSLAGLDIIDSGVGGSFGDLFEGGSTPAEDTAAGPAGGTTDAGADSKSSEADATAAKSKEKPKSVSIFKFFKILDRSDKNLCIIAFFFCFTNGLVLPGVGLAMGEVTNAYDPRNADKIDDIMLGLFKWISMFGGYMWVTGYIYYALFE